MDACPKAAERIGDNEDAVALTEGDPPAGSARQNTATNMLPNYDVVITLYPLDDPSHQVPTNQVPVIEKFIVARPPPPVARSRQLRRES